MTFSRIPFPSWFWWVGQKRDSQDIWRAGGGGSHSLAHTLCYWSADSTSLAWGPHWFYLPQDPPPTLCLLGHVCVFSIVIGLPSSAGHLLCTKVRGNKNWHRFQSILVGFQLALDNSLLLSPLLTATPLPNGLPCELKVPVSEANSLTETT